MRHATGQHAISEEAHAPAAAAPAAPLALLFAFAAASAAAFALAFSFCLRSLSFCRSFFSLSLAFFIEIDEVDAMAERDDGKDTQENIRRRRTFFRAFSATKKGSLRGAAVACGASRGKERCFL